MTDHKPFLISMRSPEKHYWLTKQIQCPRALGWRVSACGTIAVSQGRRYYPQGNKICSTYASGARDNNMQVWILVAGRFISVALVHSESCIQQVFEDVSYHYDSLVNFDYAHINLSLVCA